MTRNILYNRIDLLIAIVRDMRHIRDRVELMMRFIDKNKTKQILNGKQE